MADSCDNLRIRREDDERLVLDGLGLVRGFLAGDPSARPGGYNSLAGKGALDRITPADVTTINETMRARSSHDAWEAVFADDQAWLAAIPEDLDLIATEEAEWEQMDAAELVSAAIAACTRPNIGLARATKVLHLKRPYAFPVLDRFVLEVMGVSVPNRPSVAELVALGRKLTAAIRREGRANLDVLRCIQLALEGEGVELSLVRILDIALWFSHPAAGVPGTLRELAVSVLH